MGSGGSTQLLSPGRGWRVAQPVDWPINAHTLSLVASEQAHEAACRRRISWDVAKMFASNIDVSSSPRPLAVIWATDRKGVVLGKSVSLRLEFGGRRIMKKKNKT